MTAEPAASSRIGLWITVLQGPKANTMLVMEQTTRPFTRPQALRQGLTDGELGGPKVQRIFQGVYVRADVPVDVETRTRAALLIAPDAGSYASHHTAAQLLGSWPPDTCETHISVPDGHRSIRKGIASHRADPAFLTVRHRGILISEPTAVFLQLAASRLDLVDLVAVGDGLVRRRRTTPEALIAAAAAYQGKGARLARRAAAYVRPGVDSPKETRLRMLLVLAGLPSRRSITSSGMPTAVGSGVTNSAIPC